MVRWRVSLPLRLMETCVLEVQSRLNALW